MQICKTLTIRNHPCHMNAKFQQTAPMAPHPNAPKKIKKKKKDRKKKTDELEEATWTRFGCQ